MLVPLLDAASEQLPDFLANDGAGRDPSHGLGVPDRRSQFEYHLRDGREWDARLRDAPSALGGAC
jgi:hypothetical protein